MERYKVQGSELRSFYNENISLGRVFKDIEQDLRSANQVVCRYIVNGLELAEADEARFATVTLDQVETLEYLTENSRDLVVTVMRGWIEALPELILKTEHLSQRMRAQGLSGLYKSIHDLVQNCEFLVDSILSLKELMGDQHLVGNPVDWLKAEGQSQKTVAEALRALENKDFVLLADVLEYDLSNVLQMWHDNLKILERSLHGEYTGSHFNPQQLGSDPVGRKRTSN